MAIVACQLDITLPFISEYPGIHTVMILMFAQIGSFANHIMSYSINNIIGRILCTCILHTLCMLLIKNPLKRSVVGVFGS